MCLHIHVCCYSNDNDGIYTVDYVLHKGFCPVMVWNDSSANKTIRLYKERTCADITLLQACVLSSFHAVVANVRHQDVVLHQEKS